MDTVKPAAVGDSPVSAADTDMIDLTADDEEEGTAIGLRLGVAAAAGEDKAEMMAAGAGATPSAGQHATPKHAPTAATGALPGAAAAAAAKDSAMVATTAMAVPEHSAALAAAVPAPPAPALLPAGWQLPDASEPRTVERNLLQLLRQLEAGLNPQQHLSLIGRLQALMKPLRGRPASDPQVISLMCDYEYLQAWVKAGAESNSVLKALEGLLQGEN